MLFVIVVACNSLGNILKIEWLSRTELVRTVELCCAFLMIYFLFDFRYMNNNQFTGSLPQLDQLSSVLVMYVSQTQMELDIRFSVTLKGGDLVTVHEEVFTQNISSDCRDLSNNKLTGNINPQIFTSLVTLTSL